MKLINQGRYALVATAGANFYIGYVATVDESGIGLLQASLVTREIQDIQQAEPRSGAVVPELNLEQMRRYRTDILYPLSPDEVRVIHKAGIRWFPMGKIEWVSPWEHALPASRSTK